MTELDDNSAAMPEKPEQSGEQPKKSNIIASVIIGAMLLSVIIYLIVRIPCPTKPQYFFFRYGLAMAMACLSAILLGNLNISYKGWLSASGGFAMFVLVAHYTPEMINSTDNCNQPFIFAVLLNDSTGARIPHLKGIVSLELGQDVLDDSINTKGIAEFKNIPYKWFDTTVTVEFKINGYWLKNKKNDTSIRLNTNLLKVKVFPNDDLCCVSGTITGISEKVSDVLILADDLPGSSFHPDKNGTFNIEFPRNKRAASHVLTFRMASYEDKVLQVFPGSKQSFSVIMTKK